LINAVVLLILFKQICRFVYILNFSLKFLTSINLCSKKSTRSLPKKERKLGCIPFENVLVSNLINQGWLNDLHLGRIFQKSNEIKRCKEKLEIAKDYKFLDCKRQVELCGSMANLRLDELISYLFSSRQNNFFQESGNNLTIIT
jgi:hypothetical protein